MRLAGAPTPCAPPRPSAMAASSSAVASHRRSGASRRAHARLLLLLFVLLGMTVQATPTTVITFAFERHIDSEAALATDLGASEAAFKTMLSITNVSHFRVVDMGVSMLVELRTDDSGLTLPPIVSLTPESMLATASLYPGSDILLTLIEVCSSASGCMLAASHGCSVLKCLNGGTCFVNGALEPGCSCAEGFSGEVCDEAEASSKQNKSVVYASMGAGALLAIIVLAASILCHRKGPSNQQQQKRKKTGTVQGKKQPDSVPNPKPRENSKTEYEVVCNRQVIRDVKSIRSNIHQQRRPSDALVKQIEAGDKQNANQMRELNARADRRGSQKASGSSAYVVMSSTSGAPLHVEDIPSTLSRSESTYSEPQSCFGPQSVAPPSLRERSSLHKSAGPKMPSKHSPPPPRPKKPRHLQRTSSFDDIIDTFQRMQESYVVPSSENSGPLSGAMSTVGEEALDLPPDDAPPPPRPRKSSRFRVQAEGVTRSGVSSVTDTSEFLVETDHSESEGEGEDDRNERGYRRSRLRFSVDASFDEYLDVDSSPEEAAPAKPQFPGTRSPPVPAPEPEEPAQPQEKPPRPPKDLPRDSPLPHTAVDMAELEALAAAAERDLIARDGAVEAPDTSGTSYEGRHTPHSALPGVRRVMNVIADQRAKLASKRAVAREDDAVDLGARRLSVARPQARRSTQFDDLGSLRTPRSSLYPNPASISSRQTSIHGMSPRTSQEYTDVSRDSSQLHMRPP